MEIILTIKELMKCVILVDMAVLSTILVVIAMVIILSRNKYSDSYD